MKSFFLTFLFALQSYAVLIDSRLQELRSTPQKKIKVLILMKEGGETRPPKFDTTAVLRFLQAERKVRQGADLARADAQQLHFHWINNSFSAHVDLSALEKLSRLPSIKKIYRDPLVRSEETTRSPSFAPSDRPLYNFQSIRLDRLVTEYPDIDGRGVLIGSIDTGVEGDHPSLQGRIAWQYNAKEKKREEPRDYTNRHGTRTTGILVGPRHGPYAMGVAPAAKVALVAGLFDMDTLLSSLEYMLDPDENPDTDNAPKIINNSWRTLGDAADQEPFYRALDALDAAGVTLVFSTGNEGPKAQSVTTPKEHPATLTVAAIDATGALIRRSSRGPAIFKGRSLQKPELSAPGDKIFTSEKNGGHGFHTGTSMAAPHVTATLALMLQVQPQLNPEQLRGLLLSTLQSASDVDWHPGYGYGKLDTYSAVLAAKDYQPLHPSWFTHLYIPSLWDLRRDLRPTVSSEFTSSFTEPANDRFLSRSDFFQ